MSTTDSFPSDFLLVLAAGGAVCTVAWLPLKHHVRRSWRLRALFCLLLATTVTPTCFQMLSQLVVAPAVLVLAALILDGGKNSFQALLYGLFPILVAASLGFILWSAILRRSHTNEKAMG